MAASEEQLSYISQMLGHQTAEVSESEEQAKILAFVFGKKTSVVFDAKSICDLFKKEGQTEKVKELLANLLFTQLVIVNQNMGLPVNSRFIYQKYWELNRSVLTLSRLNEMI